MDASMVIQSQLLATKFFVPVASGTLISRPRLTALLDESLKHPFTLVSAPAGFGKTTLLSAWAQSLPANNSRVAWVSLDEEDNDPQMFWTYVLSALDMQQSERFTPLLKYLQSPQAPALKYVLTALSNLLIDSQEHFVLILDDYHLITEPEVHTTLSYLVEHLPPQLCLILSTRTDPLLSLPLLRARSQVLEVRADQLRCTTEETKAFFKVVMDLQLPDETVEAVAARTEGWLVGLQLLGLSLSLPGCANPASLLEEASGDQRYILDYLTEVVLRQQPQDVQTFLLSTCILERLNASLCDAVMQQSGSQQMLQRLEQANLFVVSLDSRRRWYRYHALFAEALHYRLERMQADLVPNLHHRASLWYAQHDFPTEAILHAFSAKEWQWAADLIERLPVWALTWGAGEHELVRLRHWLEHLPADIVHTRPRLSLACAQMLWTVVPSLTVQIWLDTAEATLTAALTTQIQQDDSSLMLSSQARQEQENLLGEVIAFRAYLLSFKGGGQAALPLCQQALSLLSADNGVARAGVFWALLRTYYASSANDAGSAIQSGLQGGLVAQRAGQTALAIALLGSTACLMIGTGRLHEAERLTQQAIQLGTQPGELVLPDVGWPTVFQAEILREWNQMDEALSLAKEALSLCQQTESTASLTYILLGYSVLLRIFLSQGELDAARSALQQVERISMRMNQSWASYLRSLFTMVDQIRLWLACGELEEATCWVEELEVAERQGPPFELEREEVARVRIFLAKQQSAIVLERLEPVLERAIAGKRWGHIIEIRLLQALAHQMQHEEHQALSALSEAVRLAEPKGYIRSFVDEGTPMVTLLSKLREQQGKDRPTPYLDTLLAVCSQQSKLHRRQSKQSRRHTKQEKLP